MSDLAVVWAKAQVCPTSRAKDVLKTLASWADAAGELWALVPVLAFEMQVDERTAQRGLAALRQAGLLLDTGQTKRHNGRYVPIYRLPLEDGPANTLQALKAQRAVATGDSGVTRPDGLGVTVVSPDGCQPCHPTGDSGVTLIGKDNSKTKHTPGAGAGEPDGFSEARLAYPVSGIRGVSGERQGAAAWQAEIDGGAEVNALIAACAAYAASPGDWGASGKPKAFHNFLSTGAWRFYADLAVQAARPETALRWWPGPAEMRTAFASALGEDWVRTWLDPCGWSLDARRVLARTGFAAGRIAGDGRAVLDALEISVGRA